jgi:ATP-dependent DNA helicase DinG
VRITAEVREQSEFRDLQLCATRTMLDLEALLVPSRSFLRKIDTFASEINVLGYLSEFESSVNRLAAFGDAIQSVLLGDSPEQVRWLEVRADNPRVVRLQTAPIDVGELLSEHLFNKHKTVVLTSATLSVSGKMNYLRQRTGLDRVAPERVGEEFFPSPFDYAEQARFFVASDLPSPDQAGYEGGLQAALPGLLRATGGRAFVLFTSMRSLQIQHKHAQAALEADGIRCLRQGDAPRDKLLKIFREDRRSVLFGTDSFWEGVDVEGESLSAVILTRLPFRVPTHPVLISRAEAIDAAGGRAFTQYVVPMAVIKFRQGFGRLIRSRADRGVVIVTDGRIVSKPYGKTFLKSLPPMDVTKAPATEIEKYVREFFETSGAARVEGGVASPG